MYLILMNPDSFENAHSSYRGAICIMNNKPWYMTNLARPSLFKIKGEAESKIKKLHKSYPNNEFIDVDVSLYLSVIDADFSNPWVNQLRQEQRELSL